MNTARIVNEAVHEVKDLLEYNLDKDLLDWGIRKEICTNIEEANYKTYGRCMQFDLIEVVDYVFLGDKMVIITKIPNKNQVDNFHLTNIITMPVNINGHFYKAKNVEGKMAIGEKYRIK